MPAVRTLIPRGLRRALQPTFLLVASALSLPAQDPIRPWLDWRTIRTATHRLHFPAALEQVARDAAARIERTDSAIAALVGSSAPKPIDVVIDDPFALANGYAIPLRDRPVTVWWATPADPRSETGNFTTWTELLAVHELTHLAHMTRPTRNPLDRLLWNLSPARLGPIARKAPRWVYEGYATYIEGRISGTGRPNNAWRPALLRQWTIEGRLPSYGQLNGSSEFNGFDFPYLGGSAFLEWLTRRAGDSSLVHVWRRLSARRVRSFDAAFAGVYGDSPAALYGRHVAELTRDAMAAKAALERAGLVEGELVQRLSWATGDPAISPNGERAVLVLRERDRPSRVVVWKTAPEPEDTAAARRRAAQQRRDPEDVPDARFYPPPKRAERTLQPHNGRGYQMPRWFPDNRRVLLTRWTPVGDGSESPALYVWDTESGDVTRLTEPVGVLHGDPHPDGRDAVAMQCHRGHCDVVRVDLARGAMSTLLEGNSRTTYYRPRYSPDGKRIAASINDGGHWRVVITDSAGRSMLPAEPDTGAINRYDAQWLGNDSLVVVSERGGVPNLEVMSIADRGTRAMTRVTGAAVAPDVNRRDGSVWYLALHARGYDVRRLTGARADSVVNIDAAQFGWAGTRGARPEFLAESQPPPTERYRGLGHQRLLPGAFASADGIGGLLSIYNGDVIGRHSMVITGAWGEPGAWRGVSVRAVRRSRPAIELGFFDARHQPSRGRDGAALADIVDARYRNTGLVALTFLDRGDGWRVQTRLGGSIGDYAPRGDFARQRRLAFVESQLDLMQLTGSRGLSETFRVHLEAGQSGARYERWLGSLELATLGRDMPPARLSVTAGLVGKRALALEHFSLGGIASPLMDSAMIRHRYAMPVLPTGIASGRALVAWRAAYPGPLTFFMEGASLAPDLKALPATWHRAVGVERRFVYGPVPVGFLPRVDIRGGAAYLLDAPFKERVRGFLEMRLEP